MTRRLARCSTVVAALALTITVVYAGGWSIITVHDVPDYAVAGKPITLTFSVRQHGNNLLEGLQPIVRATMPQGLATKVTAMPAKAKGVYTAALTLREPGDWSIRIDGSFNPEDKTRAYNSVTLLPLKVVRSEKEAPVVSKIARGEHLFVAKGCVGCHNAESDRDLSKRKLAAEYLKTFLADPGIKTTDMPNLNLKQDEIASLAAFLARR
jgi:hypothetical protein